MNWNKLPQETRDRIAGGFKAVSFIVPGAAAGKLGKGGKAVGGSAGKYTLQKVDLPEGSVQRIGDLIDKKNSSKGGGSTNKPSKVTDEGKLLPPPTSVGSARRLEPGVASHGGALPKIKEGDRWLKGSSRNAGKIPSQIAENLSGKSFRDFNHFRQEFWKAAGNDPILVKQFSSGNQTLMRNGKAPLVSSNQGVGKRQRYELDHNQELQNGGNVYDMNNIVIRTPLNHIRGK